MKRSPIIISLLLVILVAGYAWLMRREPPPDPITRIAWDEFVQNDLCDFLPLADTFQYPVRPPVSQGATRIKAFGEESSLGEHWTVGEGDAGLDEPVHAIAAGWVTFAQDLEPPWGGVVLILHRVEGRGVIESMYARLGEIRVKTADLVEAGSVIGTLGNTGVAGETYLHFEMRSRPGMQLGPGTGEDMPGWLNPSIFIDSMRNEQGAP